MKAAKGRRRFSRRLRRRSSRRAIGGTTLRRARRCGRRRPDSGGRSGRSRDPRCASSRASPGSTCSCRSSCSRSSATRSSRVGAFDTPLLLTSGTLAVNQMGFMTTLLSLLLVFYAVESMERERSTGFSAIANALPIRTSALVTGKVIALCAIGRHRRRRVSARVLDRAARAGAGRLQRAAVRARVGRARRADVPRVDRVRDRRVLGDAQPILGVRRVAGRVRLHGVSRAHEQAELARQLAAVERRCSGAT